MPLKANKSVAYLGHATKLGRRITDGPVFQLKQVWQFGLIQLTDAFFDVLGEDKIQKRLKLAIIVGKYLLPLGARQLLVSSTHAIAKARRSRIRTSVLNEPAP
jgi:hypothetical protein